jgi:hypothetical protein
MVMKLAMPVSLTSILSQRERMQSNCYASFTLNDYLEDNAWVWHNIPVGPFGWHPDFVALHPQQGIVVLKVKD